ncbi:MULTISPECIES: hypothetical protein [Candidatus Neomicrothrix]|uniref:hypothetical protein n=1 Tax=Candidatus Neomicrothrix TaxID=41949 RepID=UPI00035CC929|nr:MULTISPECIES: hypothetical protein [Microthrix]MBK7018291.1 hypothetical protein [Candidatus Microthrix sp.]MBK7324233.1 hypothetical protein [Candidatus Microthrix sp.]MBP6136047.1 hypothetical protein [Candidatus Microthrix sp.]MBP6149507.1 hypothetical protein [Candidatus Microthrix sp.]MBP7404561.1 hypothetical protein [Candidatus Microthrix sp.]
MWTSEWSPGTTWPSANRADLALIANLSQRMPTPVPRLAVAAHLLDAAHPGDAPATAARRLLLLAPALFGSRRTSGRYAGRIAAACGAHPSAQLRFRGPARTP